MKLNKKHIVYGALAMILMASCDVERVPETSIADVNFWNTPADLRLAANYFYTTLPGLTNTDVQMDNWGVDGYANENNNSISDGSRVAPASSTDYSYSGIFQANKLIEKSEEVLAKGGDATQVGWYVGEARFFRAWYYFAMLKRFGGVPLITKTLLVTDPEVYSPRATRDEILTLIYADLDYAISVLRSADQLQTAGEYGRISKTAAQAFKSSVALFEGTRAKYHNYGDHQMHLKLAYESAAAVIDSKMHDIYSTPGTGNNGQVVNNAYYNLFQEVGEGRANRENIIVRQYGVNLQQRISTTPVQRFYESGVGVTQNFVNNYLMADGLPIDKSPLYVAPTAAMKHIEYFERKDPRMSFTIFKTGDEYNGSMNYRLPNPSLQRTGFNIRKYAKANFFDIQASLIDRPILRYAEVLLNYIEAAYELNGSVSDADLDETVNLIRSRLPDINIGTAGAPHYVKMAKLSNAFVAAHGLNMRDEIRRERRVELSYETGLSYWDLIRWKTAEVEMVKPILGSYFFEDFKTNQWSATIPVDDNNYILLQRASLRKFDPKKDYLWPIPLDVINRNPDVIKQNPEW